MITVLINNYNYEAYIEEAIQSVLNQTYKDWEMIIVDDGSEDHSVEIIKKYEQLYPQKITGIYKENGGQASAMNAGFARAKGEIIAFLDSDDYWFSEKLERIADAHECYDYVVNRFRTNGPEKPLCNRKFLDKSSELLKKYGYQVSVSTPTSSISFKKKLLDKIFPIPEKEYRISADAYIDFFALYFSSYYYIDEELTFYRFHNLNGYYGQESNFDAHKFYYQILVSVNDELKKRNLSTIPRRTIKTQREMYRKIDCFNIQEKKKYVIYGAGDIGEHVLQLVKFCDGEVVCFCDGNEKRRNTLFLGYSIVMPEDLIQQRYMFDKIIIASTFYADEIEKRLKMLGFENGKDYIYTSLFCANLYYGCEN